MKKTSVFLSVIILMTFNISCTKNQSQLEENKVLNALIKCNEGIESNSTYDEVEVLRVLAKIEIETYKKTEKINECFLSEVIRCHSSYLVHQKAWKLKNQAKTQSRKEDLEKTMSLSREFAMKSLAHAGKCLKE